jgi:hypothetical protein
MAFFLATPDTPDLDCIAALPAAAVHRRTPMMRTVR